MLQLRKVLRLQWVLWKSHLFESTVSWDVDTTLVICNNEENQNDNGWMCSGREGEGLWQIAWRGGSEDCWLTAEWACSVLKCHCEAFFFLDRQRISGQVQTLNPVCFSTQGDRWLVYMCGALHAVGQNTQGPVTSHRKLDLTVRLLCK